MSDTATITKRVMHKGIEIRRSNELQNMQAVSHHNPMQWVITDVGTKWGFKTLATAKAFIDSRLAEEELKVHTDFEQFFIVRPVDGKFDNVQISKEHWQQMKQATR